MKPLEVHAKLHIPSKAKASTRTLTPVKSSHRIIADPNRSTHLMTEAPNISSLKALPHEHPNDLKHNPTASITGKKPPVISKPTGSTKTTPEVAVVPNRTSMTERLVEPTPLSSIAHSKTQELMKEIANRPSLNQRLKLDQIEEIVDEAVKPRAMERSSSRSILKKGEIPLVKQKPAKIMILRSRLVGMTTIHLNSKIFELVKSRIREAWLNIKQQWIIATYLRQRIQRLRRKRMIKRVFNCLKSLRVHIKKATQQNYTFTKPIKPINPSQTTPIDSKSVARGRSSMRSPTPKKVPTKAIPTQLNALALEEPKLNVYRPPTPISKGITHSANQSSTQPIKPTHAPIKASLEQMERIAANFYKRKAKR